MEESTGTVTLEDGQDCMVEMSKRLSPQNGRVRKSRCSRVVSKKIDKTKAGCICL